MFCSSDKAKSTYYSIVGIEKLAPSFIPAGHRDVAEAFRFYTKTKTVTSRWPTGIKEGASFSIPTME
jgi:hypothetical protein